MLRATKRGIKKGQSMKRLVIIITVIALLAGGLFMLHKRNSEQDSGGKNKGPQAVVAVTPQIRDLTLTITAVGSLIAGEEAGIHAEIAGQIKEILFQEGQPVKKGDVMIGMDKSLIETDLMRAKASLDAAKANMTRDDKLKTSGFVADQQVEASRAALQSAEAAVANAEILITKSAIKAPFDGIAGLRNFSVGDHAAEGQELTSLVSIDPLKIEFTVPEKDYASVQSGQNMTFSVDSFPGEDFTGEIYAIDPRINAENRSFTVKARIPNTSGKLRPGMYARVRLDTATRKGAMMIPEEAVVPEGTDSYVYVVSGSKAARKKITLGERSKGEVEVRDGLTAQDRIITAGTMKLKDGADITEAAAGK